MAVLADFDVYAAAQQVVGTTNTDIFTLGDHVAAEYSTCRQVLSDRAIRQYSEDIWKLPLGDR